MAAIQSKSVRVMPSDAKIVAANHLPVIIWYRSTGLMINDSKVFLSLSPAVRPGPLRAIYEGWPILALGIGAAFFLPAFATLGAAHAGLRTSLEEAAIASGAGPLRRLFRISLPLMIRDVAAIWLILFTLAFGEAGAAILREPPGFQTAQVLLFNQMHYGRNKDVAALCLLAMAISLIPLATAVCLWRRDKGTLT